MIKNYFENLAEVDELTYKEYGVTEKQVLDLVKIVKEWVKQQPHFPKEDGAVLERKIKLTLKYNKMSIERTKQKLDNYYASKNYCPEFFIDNEPLNKAMQTYYTNYLVVPLKKHVNGARVLFAMFLNTDPKKYDDLCRWREGMNYLEMKLQYDVCSKDILLNDMAGVTFEHVTRVNPTLLLKFGKTFEKAYSDRLAALHFMNCPYFVKPLVDLVKSIFKEKMRNRIFIHENLESLYEHIPREVLPKEYGGYEKSIYESFAEWREFLEQNNELLKQIRNYKTNEALRPGKPLPSDYFGVDGSFRKLDID